MRGIEVIYIYDFNRLKFFCTPSTLDEALKQQM